MLTIGETIYNCDLNDVLEELAVQLQTNNIPLLQKRKVLQTHIQVQCPYHSNGQEKRPSAGIRKSDGIFHCFACNTVHTLPEVISFCFGKEDDILGKFGNRWLQKNFQHLETEDREDISLDFSRGPKHKKEIQYVSEQELETYRWVHKYMYARGLTDEIIDLFDIGFDSHTKSITFPVRDISGGTLFIARRSVKGKRYNYPEGVEKPLYGLYELSTLEQSPQEVIVCEGMFDALTCWVYGKPAVALNGLGDELQFKQLRELSCRELILATDMDKAGTKARERIKDKVSNKIITQYVWDVTLYKDINEMPKNDFLKLSKKF